MTRSKWISRANEGLQELARCSFQNMCRIHQPPYRSLYAGGAGIAYAFWKAACLLDDPHWLHYARFWIDHVAAAPEDDEIQDIPEMPGRVFHLCVKDSFFFGNRGLFFVQALIAHSEDNEVFFNRAVKAFTAPEIGKLSVQELFRGLAGRLVGCTLLFRETREERLKQYGDHIVKKLLASAAISHNNTPWSGNHLLGLAHGRAGNYYALLLWSQETGYALPKWLHSNLKRYAQSGRKQSIGISWPIDERNEKKYMNSWCNGAPGLILLWTLAYRVYADHLFLNTARAAGEYCGIQSDHQVGHICCGAAGISYAFLTLMRTDADNAWRDQAVRCLELARNGIMDRHSRLSLYKGLAGIVCLMLDIEFQGEIALPALEG